VTTEALFSLLGHLGEEKKKQEKERKRLSRNKEKDAKFGWVGSTSNMVSLNVDLELQGKIFCVL
jgi:hypothetical protein